MPEPALKERYAAAVIEVSRELARHVARVRFEELPDYAVHAAKQFMLDTLAVAWAGSNAPGCGEARELVVDEGGRADSTLWSYGDRLPVTASAFANSSFAAALDFDSMGRASPSHVNIVVLPAALALAERTHSSGKQFLTALIAGCDLMCRIGASCQSLGNPHKGWSYSSIHGVFAAAAASAKLLGLDAPAIRHALGIAYSHSAGTQMVNIEPCLLKRMQSAIAARAGVFAALLAGRGISAPQAVFEGRYGLYRMYQEGDVERLLDALGERYENGNLSIKKFPSCGCNHTAIDGALRLAAEHDLRPDDIDSVEVEISPFMDRLVGGRFDPSGDAQAAAQFNIRYSIACAIMRRKFGLAELEDSVVRDPRIGALVDRVKVIVDPANNGTRGPMILRIRSRPHGEISCRVEHVPGSAEAPMSDEEIAAKSRECFALGARPLSSAKTETLMARIANLEQLPDMNAFFDGVLS